MKEFKIRCSGIGNIMGGTDGITGRQLDELEVLKLKENRTPKQDEKLAALILKRDTPSELLQTAKTLCETWFKEQVYARRKEFSNKFTQKGWITEDNSIDFIGEQLGLGMLIKNEEFFENEFATGTPDVILPKLIIDAKNSWDCFTFPLLDDEIPNKDYYWQAQGYMWLCNKADFKLCYVLSDTPRHLIQKEAYYYAKNNGYEELDEDIYDEFEKKMTYSDIPDNLKIKSFDIKRNDDDIEKIKEQVLKCRKYIETLKLKLK